MEKDDLDKRKAIITECILTGPTSIEIGDRLITINVEGVEDDMVIVTDQNGKRVEIPIADYVRYNLSQRLFDQYFNLEDL